MTRSGTANPLESEGRTSWWPQEQPWFKPGLLITAMACAVVAVAVRIELSEQSTATSLVLQRSSKDAVPVTENLTPRTTDFVGRLGVAVDTDALLSRLQAAAKGLDVRVASVAIDRHPATPQSLGRDDVSLTLRGSYANLKRTLGEATEGNPRVVLQHLAMTRGAAPGEQDMQLTLGLLSAPPAGSTQR